MRNNKLSIAMLALLTTSLWAGVVGAECRSVEDVDCQARQGKQIYDTGGLPEPEEGTAGNKSGSDNSSRSNNRDSGGNIPNKIMEILQNMQRGG